MPLGPVPISLLPAGMTFSLVQKQGPLPGSDTSLFACFWLLGGHEGYSTLFSLQQMLWPVPSQVPGLLLPEEGLPVPAHAPLYPALVCWNPVESPQLPPHPPSPACQPQSPAVDFEAVLQKQSWVEEGPRAHMRIRRRPLEVVVNTGALSHALPAVTALPTWRVLSSVFLGAVDTLHPCGSPGAR